MSRANLQFEGVVRQVVDRLAASEKILLITHQHPDADALGSTLALTHALRALKKNVHAVCVDEAPFRFLPGIEQFGRDCILGNFDSIVIVDCGDIKRTGLSGRIKEFARFKSRIINIDHHQKNDLHKLAKINYVDYQASSAAELTKPLVEGLGVKIDMPIATCLLAGLYGDTGGFRHSNTTVKVLEQAADLMLSGARLKKISENIANYKTVPTLKLWGLALSRINYHQELGLVTSVITQEDFVRCDACQEDLAGCVNLINCVPEARATILLYEQEDNVIKGSVRTEKNSVDAGALAKVFGGGGIKKAAGFSFSGQIIEDSGSWRIKSLEVKLKLELVAGFKRSKLVEA